MLLLLAPLPSLQPKILATDERFHVGLASCVMILNQCYTSEVCCLFLVELKLYCSLLNLKKCGPDEAHHVNCNHLAESVTGSIR